ncbi:hypothetical protein BYT27DRAFT_7102800 [Phlegmacium glaucopus]|nr:hypothetical protein BYT27DRAFT_7102800 [Phlegmacium glaucopus]
MTARYSKRYTSILTQLRTQHAPLQAYLHRFKRAESPICQQCMSEPETTMHYLLLCTKFAGPRNRLRRELKVERELDMGILGDPKNLTAIFRYINATKRFEDTHGKLDLQTETN